MADGLEVVVLVGLPGAGKSTFYRERFSLSHALVSKDLYRPGAPRKDQRQAREIDEALRSGRSVVVDNTNVSVARRALLVAAAQAHGAQAVSYLFDASVDDCRQRNAGRTGRACVPDVAILAARKEMVWPTRAEGFAEVWRVTLVAGQGFVVRPWEEAP